MSKYKPGDILLSNCLHRIFITVVVSRDCYVMHFIDDGSRFRPNVRIVDNSDYYILLTSIFRDIENEV